MVKEQVPIKFRGSIRKKIKMPLAVIVTFLVRHGAEMRRVSTVTKDHTVV